MRFLKLNNKNWRKLCKGEVQAQQLEFKEVNRVMTKEDEGKAVKIKSVDSLDECRAIQVGDTGEISLFQDGIPYVLLKTGLAKGSIYCLNEEQLEVIES